MKKLYWAIFGLLILLWSCSGSQKKSSDKSEAPAVSVESPAEDAAILDSISEAVDKVKEEIDATSKELDEILNEL